jgi:lysophospholipase
MVVTRSKGTKVDGTQKSNDVLPPEPQPKPAAAPAKKPPVWAAVGASKAQRPATPPPFPFDAGKNGGLSPPVDFKSFLKMPNPTDATVVSQTKPLLLDYLKTGQFGEFKGKGGVPIRYAVFGPPPGTPVKGVINLFSGRDESFAKYAETLYNMRDLRAQGYVIATMDHRGQGFSGRELSDPSKDYVGHFDDFVSDEKQFTGLLHKQFGDKAPFSILAHSMGGGIATRYLEEHPGEYKKAVLLSPMLDINSGFPDPIETGIANVMGTLLPTVNGMKGAGKPLSNSSARQQMESLITTTFPQTKLKQPTWGWDKQAVNATRKMMDPNEMKKLKGVDLHVFRGTADTLVQTDAEDKFAKATGADERGYWYKDANGQTQGTGHELLFHTDDVRNQVLGDIRSVLFK